MSSATALTIDLVPAAQRSVALGLLFRQAPVLIAQTLQQAREDPQKLIHLLGAFYGRQFVGAAWGQCLPGRTAILWGPTVLDSNGTAGPRMLGALLLRLERAGVQVVQAILDDDQERVAWLTAEEFLPAIDLLYMVSDTRSRQEDPPPMQFDAYRSGARQRLTQTIQLTYEGTQDAPQLNGVRRIDDVVEGYRQTGASDTAHWMLLRAEGQDVGVLLLADHPQFDQLELVYMGLVPHVRGRGWGRAVVQRAQREAERLGRRHLILAVDANNHPAVQLYQRAGMIQVERRRVALKILRPRSF